MTMADDGRTPDDPVVGLTASEVGQLRASLGFPDAVSTTDDRVRRTARGRRVARHDQVAEPPATVPSKEASTPLADDDLRRRLDLLTVRVEAMAGLVESLFDRLDSGRTAAGSPLTAEDLADISGRMVRLIEVRLEAHSERLGQVIGGLAPRSQQSPAGMQDTEILAHVDRCFEETNARQATDMGHLRRDLHRLDQAIIDMKLDQPIARLDASILEQLRAQLEEASGELAQKFDDQLSARVQRFEALSQAMMTMVGDPVDALAATLSQLVRAQETTPNVLENMSELTQIQGQLAAAIVALRQDGLHREALLREALDKLDRLT
jgi:hypothetical protein